jgi:adenine deaminase
VIEVRDSEAFNRALDAELPVTDGRVQPEPSRDILAMAMVERYGRNGNVGRAFAKGFGLKRGAIASSLSIPSNNLVAVGTNEEDIWRALAHLEAIQGGFVVVAEGKVLAQVPMPFGGIMSAAPHDGLIVEIRQAEDVARSLGCTLKNPFFTMAQTVLSTLPDLGLTDRGLVNASLGRTVPVLMEEVAP